MRNTRPSLLAVAFLAMTACGGSDATSTGTPNARVYLSSTPDDAQPAAAIANDTASLRNSPRGNAALFMGAVTVDQVDSIMIDVLAVGAVQPTDTTTAGSALTVNTAMRRINFRSLPRTTAGALALATGMLPAGEYSAVRLRFNGAKITLNTAVTSRSIVYPAGSYPLEMLHGITYAADAPVAPFTVAHAPQSTRIDVVFDLVASVASIKAATDGNLEMTPVFSATTSKN